MKRMKFRVKFTEEFHPSLGNVADPFKRLNMRHVKETVTPQRQKKLARDFQNSPRFWSSALETGIGVLEQTTQVAERSKGQRGSVTALSLEIVR